MSSSLKPSVASVAVAATVVAPAAACWALTVKPAAGGKERGRFQKLGLQVTHGYTCILAAVMSQDELGKGSWTRPSLARGENQESAEALAMSKSLRQEGRDDVLEKGTKEYT